MNKEDIISNAPIIIHVRVKYDSATFSKLERLFKENKREKGLAEILGYSGTMMVTDCVLSGVYGIGFCGEFTLVSVE